MTLTRPIATQPQEGSIGLPTASALYIAAVLGTGVLVLPGAGYAAAGPASILAIAIVLIANIPLAGTFAALAGRYPDGGGVATYVRLALGETAARVVRFPAAMQRRRWSGSPGTPDCSRSAAEECRLLSGSGWGR